MKMIIGVFKWLVREILEVVVSLFLVGTLLWSLYDGSVISWALFSSILVGLIFCILRPKKNCGSRNPSSEED